PLLDRETTLWGLPRLLRWGIGSRVLVRRRLLPGGLSSPRVALLLGLVRIGRIRIRAIGVGALRARGGRTSWLAPGGLRIGVVGLSGLGLCTGLGTGLVAGWRIGSVARLRPSGRNGLFGVW